MEFVHKPVLLEECISGLEIKKDGIYVDCTLGGGGHTGEILKYLTTGRLISFDKDLEAIGHNKIKFAREIEQGRLTIVHSDFKDTCRQLDLLNINNIDGVLMDLGVSSYQLDNKDRGFAYSRDCRLDMRMDATQELSAYEVVNTYELDKLNNIIRDYAEERYSYNIARNIVARRDISPIETTSQLVEIIDKSIPMSSRKNGGHPAKRTFQAIRIEVNSELEGLREIVQALSLRLKCGGRIAVITFHSLEDRIVKHSFKDMIEDCICSKHQPICTCHHKAELKLLTNKPIEASDDEQKSNPRSLSAKLRVAIRK